MTAISLEQRVAALEAELQLIKSHMRSPSAHQPNPNWLNEVVGSMKDFPEWDEVMDICREMREAELAEFDKANG